MIDKNKYQCWQHPNELLLIDNNKCQFHEQNNESLLKKNYKCWEKNKWMSPQNRHEH